MFYHSPNLEPTSLQSQIWNCLSMFKFARNGFQDLARCVERNSRFWGPGASRKARQIVPNSNQHVKQTIAFIIALEILFIHFIALGLHLWLLFSSKVAPTTMAKLRGPSLFWISNFIASQGYRIQQIWMICPWSPLSRVPGPPCPMSLFQDDDIL